MNTNSFDATGKYIASPAVASDHSQSRRKLGSLLVMGILGGLAVAHNASAALTQATLYEHPATAPSGGLWLNDAFGGHLWVSDHINGFCRVDGAAPNRFINSSTCYNFGLGGAAGQPAYDPLTHFVYVPDLSKKSQGITRLLFDPTGAGSVSVDNVIGSTLAANLPDAVALGPDNNLYVASRKNGAIVKITQPGCIDTATVNCQVVQTIVNVGTNSDNRRTNSMAFVGADLYLAETNLLTRMRNVALCTGGCRAVLSANVVQPQSLAYDGTYLYVGNTTDVWRSKLAPGGNPSVPVSYATGFGFVSGLAVKQATPTSPATLVFAADDPTAGIQPNNGRWWTMPALP